MHPKYNLWHNNCHAFVIDLLNRISCGERTKMLTGRGLLRILSAPLTAEEQAAVPDEGEAGFEETMERADKAMHSRPHFNDDGEVRHL